MYLIDSDRTIDWLKGRREATELVSTLDGARYLSIISYGEIYDGIYGGADPAAQQHSFEAFLEDVAVLTLTTRIMRRFARLRLDLRRSGQRISDSDLMIAASALDRDFTLVTRNVREFARVPGLRIL